MISPFTPRRLVAFILSLLAPITLCSAVAEEHPSSAPRPAPIVLRAAALFDGSSPRLRRKLTVLIEEGRIKAVGEKIAVPAGAQVIELGELTLLPGLIDAHTHLLIDPQREFEQGLLGRTSARKALDGYQAAQQLLEAGFTTVRDPGDFDAGRAHLAIRDAIEAGTLVGPRVIAAGRFITRTGGHYDLNWLAPDLAAPQVVQIADGPEALRRAVREEVKAGADWIKLAGTGGFRSGTDVNQPNFSDEELRAAIDESHRLGRKVAVHAHGLGGILAAVRAGADSIEHGGFADTETLKLMAKRGTYLVPTLYGGRDSKQAAKNPAGWIEAWRQDRGKRWIPIVKAGTKVGTKLAFGTDGGIFPHAEASRQFALFVASGLTPYQALRTSIGTAAAMLGLGKQVGQIAAGREADLIAVAGDPLSNVRVVEEVRFVMKGGRVIKGP